MGRPVRDGNLRLFTLGVLCLGGLTSPALAQQVSASGIRLGKEGRLSPVRTELASPARQLAFIENRGQFDPNVRFQVKSGGKALWFTNTGLVFDVMRPRAASKAADSQSAPTPWTILPILPPRPDIQPTPKGEPERMVFSEDFVDGRGLPEVEASAAQPGIYNYFIGNDPKNWRTSVVGYSQLLYHDVWPGIDIRFVVKGSDIEQEFLVHPGADTSHIRVAYRGAKGLQVDTDGSLVVQTLFGPLRESAPRIYSEDRGRRTSVHGSYRISGDLAYAFQLGSYNSQYPLVIDPTLLYSTYLGGSGFDAGLGIAVDSFGSAYITGYTQSTNFPVTLGAFQTSAAPGFDAIPNAFVTKLNALGSALVYSTYLSQGTGMGIAVDSSGAAYVTGADAGAGFPTTSNAWQTSCIQSAFFTKLNAAGNGLVYSTCLGENNDAGVADTGYSVAVGPNGRAYLTGYCGAGYPTTPGAFQPTYGGSRDAFVSVIDPSFSGSASLVYSSFLGGSDEDYAQSIAVDAFGNAYVAGSTSGPHFPATPGAYQTNYKGAACYFGPCSNVFLAKLNPSISGPQSLIYSTYLGGNGGGAGSIHQGDRAFGIAVDALGNAYVTGSTNSPDFPLTPGAFRGPSVCSPNCANGFQNVFVTKLNAAGNGLVYSSQIGNTGSGQGSGIAVDSSGEAYVGGSTLAPDFPVTFDAFQATLPNTNSHSFLSKLNAQGSGLVYSSFLAGQTGQDIISAIAIDGVGDAYVAGVTYSIDFPTTSPFAYQPVFIGGFCGNADCGDAFVTKFPLGAPGGLSITGLFPATGGNAGTVSPQIVGSGFHAGVTPQLKCSSESIVGANVSVGPGGRLLNTTFNLAGASPGTCGLLVTNPDGTAETLAGVFTIQQGGVPNIQISLTGVARYVTGPETPVPYTNAIMFVTVSNTGAVDAPNSLVVSSLSQQFSLTSVQPSGLTDIATMAGGGAASWVAPNLAAGESMVFNYFGTFDPTLPIFSPVMGGPVYGLPDELPPFPIPLPPPTLPTPNKPTTVEKFLTCVENELQSLPNVGTCALAVKECRAAQQACSGSTFKNLDDCYTNIGWCIAAAATCTPLSKCLPPALLAPFAWIVASDPNSLLGPAGVGGQLWVPGAQALTYAVSFGNEPTATAPAQQVVVTQQLGTNVSLSTLTLPGITIPNGTSNVQVTVPPGSFNPVAGVNEFTTNVDLRPTQSLLVNVDAKLNPATQTLTWTFTSIDPTTGSPPLNPLVGFLPPGAGASVSFSVKPPPGIATGSQIADQATVVFDANAPMSTPTWTNTIDNSPPTSQVASLPATESCPNFKVAWSGGDVGSGVQGITIFASDNGGPFTPWLSNTTNTIGTFTGAVGHTYGFYSIAQDLTGNIQTGKTAAEATTQVTSAGSCGPPSLSGQFLSSSHSGTTLTVNIQLTNTGLATAQTVNINQITARTLSGSGTVTLAGPTLPAALGPLAAGGTTTVALTLNVPSTVTRFSLTENGTLLDAMSKSYSYSIAQTIIP